MKRIKRLIVCTVVAALLLSAFSITALADAYVAPTITISGPSNVEVGDTVTYTVKISGTYAIASAKITVAGDFESNIVTFTKASSTTYNAPTTATETITVKADAIGTGTITVNAKVGDQVDASSPKIEDEKSASKSVTITAATVPVDSVSLNHSSLSMEVGDTETLIATVLPSNATDPAVSWSSSDSSIASVSSTGVVTAKKAGSAVITAEAGGKSATCNVTVEAPTPTQTVAPTASSTQAPTTTPTTASTATPTTAPTTAPTTTPTEAATTSPATTETVEPTEIPNTIDEEEIPAGDAADNNSSLWWIWLIVAAVLVAGVGIFFFLKKKKKDADEDVK